MVYLTAASCYFAEGVEVVEVSQTNLSFPVQDKNEIYFMLIIF